MLKASRGHPGWWSIPDARPDARKCSTLYRIVVAGAPLCSVPSTRASRLEGTATPRCYAGEHRLAVSYRDRPAAGSAQAHIIGPEMPRNGARASPKGTPAMITCGPPRRSNGFAWFALLGGLAACSALLPHALARRYGSAVGWRATIGLAVTVLAEQRFVAGCRARTRREEATRTPDLADALTLSRGMAAAWLAGIAASGIRDRHGRAGALGWGALLWGETVSDWLDGPLARRRGSTALGRMLDLEADSWLTLWAALAAVLWGELPPWYVAAPALHYLLPFIEAHPADGAPARPFPRRDRAIGVAQMAIITVALCPWAPRSLRARACDAASPVAIASLACLLAQERVRRRSARQEHRARYGAGAAHARPAVGRTRGSQQRTTERRPAGRRVRTAPWRDSF